MTREEEILQRYMFLARTIGLIPRDAPEETNDDDDDSADIGTGSDDGDSGIDTTCDNIIPFPTAVKKSSDLLHSGNKTGINNEKE